MNVLTDILCDKSSLLASQGYEDTLSRSKMMSHDVSTKRGPLNLLDTVSHMVHIERPLPDVNDSSPSIDIFNSSGQLHIPSNIDSGFDDRSQVSVFSDQFPEIVPSWLAHDFMKVSDTMPSPGILSNVSDIYPSRENEHLEMLDLGFPHELTSHDVSSNLNRTCIDDNQKLLAELPLQRFSTNDTLMIPSFNDLNANQLHLSMGRNNMDYHKFKPDAQRSLMNSVMPCENELLHLPLPSNLTEQCLNSTSSPSIISSSQSQSHLVDVVCDKLPQINLNHLDSLLGSTETTLSEIHLLRHDFPNVRMQQENCNPQTVPCLTNCHSSRIMSCNPDNFLGSDISSITQNQDASVQVPEEGSNINFGSVNQNCFSCSQVHLESPIDEIRCFKCKFCDYISVHKCAVSNHIDISHSKAVNSNLCLTDDNTQRSDDINSLSVGDQSETHLPTSESVVSSTISTPPANVMPTEKDPANLTNHFQCVKCSLAFSEVAEYNSHLMTHDIKPDGVPLNVGQITIYYQSLPTIGILLNQPKENMAIKEINGSNSVLQQSNLLNKKQIPLKCKAFPKKSNDSAKKNSPKKVNSRESSNPSSEKQLSSHKKAWQKKMKRELGSYICEFKGCNVRFRALDNLEYHKKCHISGGSSFACPDCNTSFENWGAIAGHLWREHGNDMELHACDQCQFRTYSLSRLENIHKRIHKNEYLFLCDTCGKSFKTGKQLRNHRDIHLKHKRKVNLENWKCNICGGTFSNKPSLRKHHETVHSKVKPFVCHYCEFSTSKKSSLQVHIRVHTGEKPFKCDKCQYETSDHNSLRRHKMIHSGEKQYKCPYCPYSSIQASTYKAHLKKHPGQSEGLMFSCTLCPFRTLKQDSYQVHMTEHETANRPQRNNSINEIDSTEDVFPIAEALNMRSFSWCT